MIELTDPALQTVAEKISAGTRLTHDDAEAIFTTRDLHGLGALADGVRRRLHGDATYYSINRHIHTTNVCALRCAFCNFGRGSDDDGAYELTVEAAAALAREARKCGAGVLHVTGGLHPQWTLDDYTERIRALRQAAPATHIRALTAVEIDHVARRSGCKVDDALKALQQAGVDSLPGGGAEIFDPAVRQQHFPDKLDPEGWLAIHAAAHRLGLASNATMLYGLGESPAQRAGHLLRLRRQQDQSGGFNCMVPLSFQPGQVGQAGPGGLDDLRTVAACRLVLDNIPHVKTFWVMHGLKLSQLALRFGADDIHGPVMAYDIVETDRTATDAAEFERLIAGAGLRAVCHDGAYRPM